MGDDITTNDEYKIKILGKLKNNPNLSQRQIVNKISDSPKSIHTALNFLIKIGAVQIDKSNKRKFKHSISPLGEIILINYNTNKKILNGDKIKNIKKTTYNEKENITTHFDTSLSELGTEGYKLRNDENIDQLIQECYEIFRDGERSGKIEKVKMKGQYKENPVFNKLTEIMQGIQYSKTLEAKIDLIKKTLMNLRLTT